MNGISATNTNDSDLIDAPASKVGGLL
jgi:hypothetical protein